MDSAARSVKLLPVASSQSGFCRSFRCLFLLPQRSFEPSHCGLTSPLRLCSPTLPPRFPFPHPICQRERRKVGGREDEEGKEGSPNETMFLPGSSPKTPGFIFPLGSLIFLSDFWFLKLFLKTRHKLNIVSFPFKWNVIKLIQSVIIQDNIINLDRWTDLV